jgi:hypothetical protein
MSNLMGPVIPLLINHVFESSNINRTYYSTPSGILPPFGPRYGVQMTDSLKKIDISEFDTSFSL